MKIETLITKPCKSRKWPFPDNKTKKVKKATEKESDVALASQVGHDAHTSSNTFLIIITNDTDFAPAIRIIQENTSKVVGILCPGKKPAGSLMLTKPAFVKLVEFAAIYQSQLPNFVEDKHGSIQRPKTWT